ncbi:protein of unknown function DUF542 ScdA domain protein (plasmid) [Gemmatirosa kalamazoonensis]|uniref:Iron-sulfur cluster repair di-iron protein n=1 Tax=Gemmatirosa kalamazoonensis TaxID=861299 RepID=W0RP98_9BACT|nr:DUF542 domain-containing protein [Gemmatirosa kalamazoonensis]AHG92561.1 protein of unknown function DUF542 ScdA domain protein [Gemmatirosa kalamazoonensis]
MSGVRGAAGSLSDGRESRPIPRVDPATTVNELLRQHPAVASVLDGFGIDACCGGARTLRDAAREDGADCCAFVAALEWALFDEE